MDTTVVKIPFVSLASVGRAPDARSFQFNRLILGMIADSAPWPRYLHGELLHLTSLLYYPLIERMPFDSRLSKKLFFALRSALGVGDPLLPGPDHDRQPSGARRRSATDGKPFGSAIARPRTRSVTSGNRFPGCGPPCGTSAAFPEASLAPLPGRGSTTPGPCRWAMGRSDAIPGDDPTSFRISTSPMAPPSRRCPASRSRCRWPRTRPALRESPSFEERRPVSAVADRPAGIRRDLRLLGSHAEGASLRPALRVPGQRTLSFHPPRADFPGSWPSHG